ncbi:hypothetical protein [Pseudogemmobacter sonorensis]|uniref:hypothetical protein n=1 Tax=Pseudogemmobacter sonorensis TaxID=2989681 RepID=UPI0036ACC9BC
MSARPLPSRLLAALPPLWLVCLLAGGWFLFKAALALPHAAERLMQSDNDDLMRLVVVRDWLQGQGWFDTRQYRILPPEGISLHWSRYVDGAIAALMLAAASVMPLAAAEMFAVTFWPALLALVAICVIAFGTGRLFGRLAALVAVATFLTLPQFENEFAPGRIDHHNVQILCALAIFHIAVWPLGPRALLAGALAGGLTALSLAVGLEMLPFLALVWGMAALRHAFALPERPGPSAPGVWLRGFALGLGIGAPLLMAGQVPVRGWATPWCDVLAPPVLTLGAIGILATLAPVWLEHRLRPPAARIGLVLGLAGAGIALAWPVLGPCAAGPYAMIAPDVREIIDRQIIEGHSVPALLVSFPVILVGAFLPGLLIGAGALLAIRPLAAGGASAKGNPAALDEARRFALATALVVLAGGLVVAMTQIRASNLFIPVLPLLSGFLVQAVLAIPRAARSRAPMILLALLAMPITLREWVPPLLEWAGAPGTPRARAAAMAEGAPEPPRFTGAMTCRSAEAMAEIAALPEGAVVFSRLHLGTAILAYTPHSATSAPYHRSNDAFRNGMTAFDSPRALVHALRRANASHLVLCHAPGRDRALAERIAEAPPAWLVPLGPPRADVAIYRIRPALLPEDAPADWPFADWPPDWTGDRPARPPTGPDSAGMRGQASVGPFAADSAGFRPLDLGTLGSWDREPPGPGDPAPSPDRADHAGDRP